MSTVQTLVLEDNDDINSTTVVYDKNSRQSHFYRICPPFQNDPALFQSLVLEAAAQTQFTSLVSFDYFDYCDQTHQVNHYIRALETEDQTRILAYFTHIRMICSQTETQDDVTLNTQLIEIATKALSIPADQENIYYM